MHQEQQWAPVTTLLFLFLLSSISNAGIIISFLTIIAMILASRYVYLTAKVFQKIKTEGVHGVFSVRFNESSDDDGGSRR
jgi:hypothetical protein